ncbi:tRNA pseudouridine synthase A [Operophtera brumata]|uniref:tRNA pseudouridine synthase A n=1 Tax=Operophtera brumata TaxID=104452 RepID=A0A0L7L688_OPEBR|nr:tRNA pseudouridine synthase A [Operophtera brumata]
MFVLIFPIHRAAESRCEVVARGRESAGRGGWQGMQPLVPVVQRASEALQCRSDRGARWSCVERV